MQLGRQPGALDEVLDFMRHADPLEAAESRRALLSIIVDLGRVWVPAEGDVPEHPGPIITEPKVVHLLVELLYSKDSELRRTAFVTLAGPVPASMLTPYPDTIHTVVRQHPTTDGALLLLGKSSKPSEALAVSYYAAIEAWLVDHRGSTWSRPRPPFLYEESAPQAR